MQAVQHRAGDEPSLGLPGDHGRRMGRVASTAINLSPNKYKVFGEIHRVLRPGGRMQIGDIIVQKPIPDSAKRKIDLWTG
jgi:arsenite methyltransferase